MGRASVKSHFIGFLEGDQQLGLEVTNTWLLPQASAHGGFFSTRIFIGRNTNTKIAPLETFEKGGKSKHVNCIAFAKLFYAKTFKNKAQRDEKWKHELDLWIRRHSLSSLVNPTFFSLSNVWSPAKFNNHNQWALISIIMNLDGLPLRTLADLGVTRLKAVTEWGGGGLGGGGA